MIWIYHSPFSNTWLKLFTTFYNCQDLYLNHNIFSVILFQLLWNVDNRHQDIFHFLTQYTTYPYFNTDCEYLAKVRDWCEWGKPSDLRTTSDSSDYKNLFFSLNLSFSGQKLVRSVGVLSLLTVPWSTWCPFSLYSAAPHLCRRGDPSTSVWTMQTYTSSGSRWGWPTPFYAEELSGFPKFRRKPRCRPRKSWRRGDRSRSGSLDAERCYRFFSSRMAWRCNRRDRRAWQKLRFPWLSLTRSLGRSHSGGRPSSGIMHRWFRRSKVSMKSILYGQPWSGSTSCSLFTASLLHPPSVPTRTGRPRGCRRGLPIRCTASTVTPNRPRLPCQDSALLNGVRLYRDIHYSL